MIDLKRKRDHVVIDCITNKVVCKHCGVEYKINLPCPIDIFVAIAKEFLSSHGDCQPNTGRLSDGKSTEKKKE